MKKMSICALCLTLVLLLVVGGITAVIDPFFHFHGPWDWQAYRFYDQRYQNDGITRHFDYDAIIIGTSMTENFKTSECDALFGTQAIKIPFSGASYKELNDALVRALGYAPEVTTVFRGIDLARLFTEKDYMRYEQYPDYLYDDDPFNDVNYLFNKELFADDVLNAIKFTRITDRSYTFDRYANWNDKHTFGKEAVLDRYYRPKDSKTVQSFTEADAELIRGTIRQNVTDVAKANPQIQFYFFFPPYSVLYWDSLERQGNIDRYLQGMGLAIELMLECDNVRVFSFFEQTDITCDLSIYMDHLHYNEDINSQMLLWMANGEHELTGDDLEAYLQGLNDFYSTYPYDTIFE